MNKVDQLDNNVDFARAFGTLGLAGFFSMLMIVLNLMASHRKIDGVNVVICG